MRRQVGKCACKVIAVCIGVQILGAAAQAVDTMSDWTGVGNTGVGNNNYVVISPTSVGGQMQGVVPLHANIASEYHLADTSLSAPGGVLDFRKELHMSGIMTFTNPNAILPNMLFGWFDKDDTRHRIGIGFSNITTTSVSPPLAEYLRIDLGWASTNYTNPNPPPTNLGNYFPYVSANGMVGEENLNSVIPSGSHRFTFDYIPGPAGMEGGSMSATVGNFFHVTQPIGTLQPGIPGTLVKPWDTDFFEFDSFGFQQRYRSSFPGHEGPYYLTISDVTYTGGSALHAGDFDGDGDVDGADFVAWQTNFPKASGAKWADGDADGDGDVDGADFVVWQTNFPFTPGPGTSPVPEPNSMLLLLIGGLAVVAQRRHRRS
jgi:hypothetical protein